MSEFTEDDRKRLYSVHDALVGTNGKGGLIDEVKKLTKEVEYLAISHDNLKRNFYMLVAFMVGAGILTGGYFGFLRGL